MQPDCSNKNCINGEKRAEEKQNSFFIMPIIFLLPFLRIVSFLRFATLLFSLMNRNLEEKYDAVKCWGEESSAD
jgi:hypothetical protein